MSKLTEYAAQEELDTQAASVKIDAVKAGIQALDDKISALQAIPADVITAEDMAALDSAKAHRQEVLAKILSISTDAPAEPVAADAPPVPEGPPVG